MTNISTSEKIKESLHRALEALGKFEECALLDYPDYPNIGDHLIWMGTVFYLTNVLKTKIKYSASLHNFSAQVMEKKIGKAPILLQGGGNLGDLYPWHQKFRERIISKYRDRPIIILPQTLHFNNQKNLNEAADVFNSHPNLTLFLRDNYSYNLAIKHFDKCHLLQAPDMAFHLVTIPKVLLDFINPEKRNYILYLCRSDYQTFSKDLMGFTDLVMEDWISFSYKWIYKSLPNELSSWYWYIPGMVPLFREVWQRRLGNITEWTSRQDWQNLQSYTTKFEALYKPSMHRYSWSLIHSGIYQLKQYPLVITNRTHGHILCTILGIPHLFMPGSYHKNKSFYETWTYQVTFCRFVKDASQIGIATQELLDSFSSTSPY